MLSPTTCARLMPLSRLLAPQRAPHFKANAPRLVPFMRTHHFNLNLSRVLSLALSHAHTSCRKAHATSRVLFTHTHTHTHTHAAQQGKHAEASALHFAHSSIHTWPSPHEHTPSPHGHTPSPHEHTPSPRADTSSALSTSFASPITRAQKLLSRLSHPKSLYKCPESPGISRNKSLKSPTPLQRTSSTLFQSPISPAIRSVYFSRYKP